MSALRSLPGQHCLPDCHLVNEGQVALDGGLILLLLLLQLPAQLLLRLLNTSNREVTLLCLQGALMRDSGAESLPGTKSQVGEKVKAELWGGTGLLGSMLADPIPAGALGGWLTVSPELSAAEPWPVSSLPAPA